MKKIIAFLTALLMCLPTAIVPSTGAYYDFSYNGNAKTLTIEEGPYLNSSSVYLPEWTNKAETIIVEPFVLKLDLRVLKDFQNLKTIVIKDDDTEILSYTGFGEESAYAKADKNWDGDGLYIGNRLVGFKKESASLEIRDGTTEIAPYACSTYSTEGASLTDVKIPDSVKIIGERAFEYQAKLEHVAMPDSIESIGFKAFNNCRYLREITIPAKVTEISAATFHLCSRLRTVNLNEGLKSIGAEAFSLCDGLENINFPDGLSTIEYRAFFDCNSLSSVTLPDTVTSLGIEAFRECDNLREVTFGGLITKIPDLCFCGCESLERINFGGASIIGASAFEDCYSLREADFGCRVNIILDNAFKGCKSISDLSFIENCKSIGAYAFEGCTGLTYEELPESVIRIGDYAFKDCSNLSTLEVKGSGVELHSRIFAGCDKFMALLLPSSFDIRFGTFIDCDNKLHLFINGSEAEVKKNSTSGFLCETNAIHYDCTELMVKKTYTDNQDGEHLDVLCGVCGGVLVRGQWFSDVPKDSWYHDSVVWAAEHEVFNVVSDSLFAPSGDMTRAMLVTVLWRMQGEPVAEGEHPFTDVKSGSWYDNALNWAFEAGITDGRSPTVFDPNGVITREQMATMLYRYSVYAERDVTASGELDSFPDEGEVSSWATNAVKWSVGAGIIEGNNRGGVLHLDPKSSATRAQVATMLMRYTKKNL